MNKLFWEETLATDVYVRTASPLVPLTPEPLQTIFGQEIIQTLSI